MRIIFFNSVQYTKKYEEAYMFLTALCNKWTFLQTAFKIHIFSTLVFSSFIYNHNYITYTDFAFSFRNNLQ